MADLQISLREPTLADVPAIARVHLASWLHAYRGVMDDAYLNGLQLEAFAQFGAKWIDALTGRPLPGLVYRVAQDEAGAVVGFARGGPNRPTSPTGDPLPEGFHARWASELYAIYVDPAWMGKGVGAALFRVVKEELANAGHRSMCLWVLEGNTLSRRFYERMGGTLCGEGPITLGGKAYPQVAYGW